MTGNALNNTARFEPSPREAAGKLLVTRRLALGESQRTAMSPKNNPPSRYETEPGSSSK